MRAVWILFAVILTSCATVNTEHPEGKARFGVLDESRYDHPLSSIAGVPDYWRDIKPIFDRRCVECHGCNDAPCQLNLASYEGLTRGANKDKVYATRLLAADPTRLFIDAHQNAGSGGWREKKFYPVLNEYTDNSPDANREASVLYRMLILKRDHPLQPTEAGVLPSDKFDFSLDRKQQCAALGEMDAYEKEHPDCGMPYGLPALSDKDYDTLARWIEAGAPYRAPDALPDTYAPRIAQWETFLNGDSLKAQLSARYIYEHWFLAHLYFDDLKGAYFRLVRSRTPPGEPVDEIASRRPFDDPGVPRVYYRFVRATDTILTKTHMPLALNAALLAKLKTWFIDAPYEVTALPSYAPEVASNPFLAFEQLPIQARYQLMLENAQFTIMGFIKGPVCRGQVALNVINDYFWVVFVRPDMQSTQQDSDFLAEQMKNLRLPAENESSANLLSWLAYGKLETHYLQAKTQFYNERFDNQKNLPTLKLLWDGSNKNPNAALTVFRHFDSATVVQGLIGDKPQTAWLIGYPTLERIHYLLTAGFDVYGNVGHQLATRLYMDFLRIESEMNFIALLPRDARQSVIDQWYRDADNEQSRLLRETNASFIRETGIPYKTDDPLDELYGMLKTWSKPFSSRRYDIANAGLKGADLKNLQALAQLHGKSISILPETTFIIVRDKSNVDHYLSLLRNTALANVTELFDERNRRLPDEDTLTLVNGFVGAYPNAFLLINTKDLPDFVQNAGSLANEDDYRALLAHYGVRRSDERFWSVSDELTNAYKTDQPIEAGLFDYNRFENR